MGWRSGRDKLAPIVNVQGVFNAVQRVAGTVGKRLVQKKGLEGPYTDLASGEVYVEEMNAYWPQAKVMQWLGEVHHELGHHSKEVQDTLPYMKAHEFDSESYVGRLLNLVDDVRNEMNHYGEFIGRDEALSCMQGHHAIEGAKVLKKMIAEGKEISSQDQTFIDALSWVYDQRQAKQPDVAIGASDWGELTDQEKYYHLNDELANMKTIEDAMSIVNQIMEANGEDPEEKLQESQEDSKSRAEEGEGESGEGSGEGSEGDGEEDGEGEGGDKSGDSDEEQEASVIPYDLLMAHSHSDQKATDKESKLKIDYSHSTNQEYVPYDKMLVKKARSIGSQPRGIPQITAAYQKGQKLASAARRLFQSRTQSMKTHNHKGGRLDKRDLYRIPNGAQDVFLKKEEATDPKGTAIFLLTDASGSMSGHKFNLTGACAALLNEAVQPLQIPLEIAAFTDTYTTGPQHYVVKTFNEKRTSEKIIEDYGRIRTKLCQNCDGESIMWAYEELMKRTEPRKILIVISDGQPASDNYGDCYTYTKNVVAHVGKNVECYGIGLLDDSVKDFYPEYTVLKNADELEACLLNVVKTKIFD